MQSENQRGTGIRIVSGVVLTLLLGAAPALQGCKSSGDGTAPGTAPGLAETLGGQAGRKVDQGLVAARTAAEQAAGIGVKVATLPGRIATGAAKEVIDTFRLPGDRSPGIAGGVARPGGVASGTAGRPLAVPSPAPWRPAGNCFVTPIQIDITRAVIRDGMLEVAGALTDRLAPGSLPRAQLVDMGAAGEIVAESITYPDPKAPFSRAFFELMTPAPAGAPALRYHIRAWSADGLRSNRSDTLRPIIGAPAPAPGLVRIAVESFSTNPAETRWSGGPPTYEGNPRIREQGATHLHAFGSGTGRMTYWYGAWDKPTGRVTVVARLSAEAPMFDSPPEATSSVVLQVNGVSLEEKVVIGDNGSGHDYSWEVPAGLLLPDSHNSFAFVVEESGSRPNGVCIYGKAAVPGLEDADIRILYQ